MFVHERSAVLTHRPLSAVAALTIALGLLADRFGGAWGQPLVALWTWALCGWLLSGRTGAPAAPQVG